MWSGVRYGMSALLRNRLWLYTTALAVVLASVLWVTLVMAAPNSQSVARPAAVTLIVNSTGDAHDADTGDGTCDDGTGNCTLRAAIEQAASGDTIDVPSGIYTLTLGIELTIDKDLILTGAGSGDTIIEASSVNPVLLPDDPGVADSRVFNITGGDVAISGVTIRHGNIGDRDAGASIRNQGILTLTGVMVSANFSGGDTGGIYNTGELTLTNSTVSNNTAARNVGGILNDNGTLILINSSISSNKATGDRGGGILNSGTLTLTNSTVSGNSSRAGAGIYNWGEGMVELINTTVSGNTAVSSVGGIYNTYIMTLTNSTVSNNTAARIGGVWNSSPGKLTLTNSTVSNNTSIGSDGGIASKSGTVTIINSTVSGNVSGGNGGGIDNWTSSTMTLTNSTISNNISSGDGGGIRNVGTLTLTNSTISGNTGDRGGGIYNGRTLKLTNTIVASNTAPSRPDCFGSLTSLGHNLLGNNLGCSFIPVTGDLLNVDPKLGPLQDNGGPAFTNALLPFSPAIDAGVDTACPATDQRGVTRPQGTHCDIGAYELVPDTPPVAFDQSVSTTGDAPVVITLTGSDADTGDTLTFLIVSLPGSGDLFVGPSVTGDKITMGYTAITGDTVTYTPDLRASAALTASPSRQAMVRVPANIATVTVTVTPPAQLETYNLWTASGDYGRHAGENQAGRLRCGYGGHPDLYNRLPAQQGHPVRGNHQDHHSRPRE